MSQSNIHTSTTDTDTGTDMNNSDIFKAAHAVAKAYQAEFGGHYSVYFQYALKSTHRAKKDGISKEKLFAGANKRIKAAQAKSGVALKLLTKKVVTKGQYGLQEFSHRYKLDKAESELPVSSFFGKKFVNKEGQHCAWLLKETTAFAAY